MNEPTPPGAASARARAGVSIAELTTMRVGGPAAAFVETATEAEVIEAVRAADAANEPLLVLGGGSNIVLSDAGFDGTVVRITTTGIRVESEDACSGVCVRVAAGTPWDDLVAAAVRSGWAGIEALSGIPGSTGATPVQNVGAYGQEVSQTITNVRVWDRHDGAVRTLFARDLAFSYRHSVLKESALASNAPTGRYVVLDVGFQLHRSELSAPIGYAALATGLDVQIGARVPLLDARAAVLEQRRQRGMVLEDSDHDTWSCGSFFTNPLLSETDFAELERRTAVHCGTAAAPPPRFPAGDAGVKTSAAWLIDRAGFSKGFGAPGPVSLSTKHTLAVTNRGNARAEDVVALARTVRDGVEDVFGVRLVNEPVLVGLEL